MTKLSDIYSGGGLDPTKINNLDQAEEYDWTLDSVSDYYYQTSEYLPLAMGADMWMKAGKETTFADDEVIEKPTDFSGDDLDFTQATEGYRAKYKTNIMNGKPVFRYDGTDDFYPLSSTNWVELISSQCL